MEVIDAHWEKRNFGYDVVEIVIGKNDLGNIDEIITNLKEQYLDRYIVVKIPVAQLDLLHKLEGIGFNYMETAIALVRRFDDDNFVAVLEGAENPLETEPVKGETDFLEILEHVEDSMFLTDRVYLDPALDNSIATKRYVNWLKDLYYKNDNCQIRFHVDKKTNKRIGFAVDVYDKKKMVVYGLLGGIYREYQNGGYFPFTLQILEHYFRELGVKKLKIGISSNNFAIFRIYSEFGYQVSSSQYVLRRIKRD